MINFNQFGKSSLNKESSPVASSPVALEPVKKNNINFNQFGKSSTYTPVAKTTEDGGGSILKSLITAPATIVARPFQLAAEAIIPGDNTEAIDKFSREKLGGIVAPVPKNYSDVKKDTGRAIQTVALGTGAPLAGGAAFGLGSSLEQGNDLLSTQTAFNTVLGAGLGKLTDLVGKPLFNSAGKVIGKITPQALNDVASKGANAITEFAKNHELLGGAAKPISEKISTGMQSIDDKAGKLFTGAKEKVSSAVKSQYPDIKTNAQKYYEKKDVEQLFSPIKDPKGIYKEARGIYDKAKTNKIDLEKTASENKIYANDLIDNGVWNTEGTEKALRQETSIEGHDLLRPALAEAEAGVRRIPISEIRDTMVQNVKKIPTSKITDAERQKLVENISKEYADDSAAALQHPDGYSLTDLHDAKLNTSGNVVYSKIIKPNVQEKLSNTYYKQQSSVFKKLLEDTAPKEIGVDAFNKKLQDRFTLADYLASLHGKKVPRTLFQNTLKKGAQLVGGGLGGGTGNVYGMFGGYQLGGMFMDTFMNMSNPVKSAFLKSISKTQPEAFNAIREYIGDQQFNRLMKNRAQLPAGSKIDSNLQNLKDEFGAIPMGPKRMTPSNKIANDVIQNKNRLFNTGQLPAPSERMITPNTQGTPNILGRPYTAGGESERIGGMSQKIGAYYPKKKK